ncbi:hypothetical protein LIER_13251 [Lithospermum erythrorhizon]|uniref:Uncharacterized protein n=1 Tax=Lithospermum erythrorhizon TaxID=34254 RepID=A0AAV3Q006_LITER
MMLSLALQRLSPHRITAVSRWWSCYFSVSAAKTPSEEDLVASHVWLGYVSPEDSLDEGIKYYLVMDGSSRAIRLIIDYKTCNDEDVPGTKEYVHDMHSLELDNKLDVEWFKVEGLVDTALFIGRNNGVVVDAHKSPLD